MRKGLLSLYPEAWRERYGAEMSALLDDSPPSVSATVDLLRGALMAHLRPLAAASPAVRARGTVAGVLGCFIVFCVFGAGFAKTTENFDYTEHVHPLLGVSHQVIAVGAMIAGAALVLAAVPLIVVSLAQARRTRDPSLIKLIAIPPVAIAIFAGSVGLLALWLNAHHHRAGVEGWLLLALCALCAAIGAIACWAAPRAIMRRLQLPRVAWLLCVPALAVVAVSMVVVAAATGIFLIGLVADASNLGAMGNGPGQVINVTVSIAIQFAAMLALGATAAISATRGLRATAAQ